MTTIAAVPDLKLTCYFEYTGGTFKQNMDRGRPDRIFSSKDPRWAVFEKERKTYKGSLIVASVMRIGDEDIYPPNPPTPQAFHRSWEKALEQMKLWEEKGVLWENTLADEVRREEEKAERAQQGIANAIVAGLAQAMRPAEATQKVPQK